mgnify:FL=1
MPITKPQLPPKAGYVEVEVDGVRRYKSIASGHLLGEEPEPCPTPIEDHDELIADLTYRLTLLELGLEVNEA